MANDVRPALRVIGWVAGVYVAWLALLFVGQRFLMYPAQSRPATPKAAERVPGADVWWLETEDGPVEAWFLPGRGVSASRPGPALVYFHGNGELIEDVPRLVSEYRRLGISVLLPEYRGYGASAGSPSEAAIVADALAFYDLLVAQPEVDARRVAVHGRSLGSGPATQLAAARPIRAVILTSPYTSMRAFAARYLAPGFLVRDPFDNLAALEGVEAPVLVLHGRRDRVVPYEHGEAVAEAAGAKLITFDGAGHNDVPVMSAAHRGPVEGHLRAAGML